MIPIAKKKTLTDLFLGIENSRTLYKKQYGDEKIIENTKKRKLSKHSTHYKYKFIKNYEAYYKKGGQRRNKIDDNLYNKLTGKDPLPVNKAMAKPRGRKRQKNYSKQDKIKYYRSRMNDESLTRNQRIFATNQLKKILKG